MYKARRPFHPKRFMNNFIFRFFMYGSFGVDGRATTHSGEGPVEIEIVNDNEHKQEDPEDPDSPAIEDITDFSVAVNVLGKVRSEHGERSPEYQQAANDADDKVFAAVEQQVVEAAEAKQKKKLKEEIAAHQHLAKMKQQHRNEVIGGVLRSKGYIWATHFHDTKIIYQQSCNTVTIDLGDESRWDVLNPQAWEDGNEKEGSEFRQDFMGSWGDRRQEIVFIGNDMKHEVIQKLLDECLLTDEEYALGIDAWKAKWGGQ